MTARRGGRAASAAALAALVAVALAGACSRSGPGPRTTPPALPAADAGDVAAAPAAPPGEAAAAAPAEPVTPAAPLPPAVEPAPEAAAGATAAPRGPILLRVGLASDLAEVELPGAGGARVVPAGGAPMAIASPLVVRPGGAVAAAAVYRLQAAALRDEGQARELARRLAESTGEPADVGFDAGSGLYRVRLGRWPARAGADAARARLAGRGVAEAWVVSEGGGVTDPELHLALGGREVVVPGRWLAIDGDGERGIRAGGVSTSGGRYRGRLLVYLNDRGQLNLINELPLEDYLRGVVPAEMGPELYPRLEALKAQAVAARTYTLRNLGEFAGEGYDICATPRCQVYRGMAAEHPLSDRAVAETEGQVLLWRGELVDARYSATCGGHTEDVRTIFPLEDAPYLRGVPCLENGGDRLAGALPRGEPFPEALTRRLFPEPAAASPGELLQSLEEVAGYHRALETDPSGKRRLVLRVGGDERRIELPAALATFRLRGEDLESADLALSPGDRVRLYRFDGYPVALIQEVDPAGAPADGGGAYGSWTRFRSDARLARLVEERYPGLGFSGLEVLARGVSGRVGRMRVLGAGGASVVVEGLAVRWTLDLPDTRFSFQRLQPPRGEQGYLFTGSGWGHGVGLCQLGAFSMAGRRHTYRQILQHYYTGVTLARVQARAPRWQSF